MREIDTENVLVWFTDLESRFSEIIKYIPTDRNLKISYPLLASIIVEAGSLIDTIFQKEYSSRNRPKGRKLNISDFAPFYEQKLNLSAIKTIPFLYPPRILSPFKDWYHKSSGNYKAVGWWQNYNKLKHDRIKEYKRSTLQSTLYILCALHQLISQSVCFLRSLFRHGMVTYDEQYDFEFIRQCARKKDHTITVLIESKIFATPLGGRQFPDDISDIVPFHFGNSKRLINFLGWNFNSPNSS